MRFFSIIFLSVASMLFFGYEASALTVAPTIIEIEVDPGASIEREITVFNETNQSIIVSAQIESFVPRGDRGAAQTVNDGNQSLRWVQLGQNTLTIAPGVAQTIPILVTVPKTASVGGYYMAILWQQSASSASNVNLNGRVGALLLVTVKGEVRRSLSIEDFNAVSLGWRESLRTTVNIRNDGNVHVKPRGLLVIKNIFNRVVATVPINAEEGNVLPQSIRKFEVVWPGQAMSLVDIVKRLVMVRASVYAEIDYDGGTKITSAEQHIWTISLPIVAAPLIMIIVFTGIVFVVKKNKKTQL